MHTKLEIPTKMNRKFYGMHSFLRFAALAALIAIPACADVFSVKGVFDNTTFAGPLNGGSFSGIFSVTGLPVANGSEVFLTSWDVILRDASHTVLAELTTANGCSGCSNVDGQFAPASGDLLNFGDSSGDFLELQFFAPYNGVGSAIPFASRIGIFGSFAGIGGNTFGTTSAVASASTSAVPEPSSGILLGTMLCLIFVQRARRAKSQRKNS